jgi:hypothetical protein
VVVYVAVRPWNAAAPVVAQSVKAIADTENQAPAVPEAEPRRSRRVRQAPAAATVAAADPSQEVTLDPPQEPADSDAAQPSADEPGRTTLTLRGSDLAAANRSSIPLMAQVRFLPLTDDQRAAIEQFEETFQQALWERMEHHAAEMRDATGQIRQAIASGEQDSIQQAQQLVMELTRTRAEAMQQLNQEYLDGIRPCLTQEQAQILEKAAAHTQAGATWRHTTTSTDGTSGGTVNHITVWTDPGTPRAEPGNPPAEPQE